MDFSPLRLPILLSGLVISVGIAMPVAQAKTVSNDELKQLEDRFRAVSSAVYTDFTHTRPFGNTRYKTLTELEQTVSQLVEQGKHIQAIDIVKRNLNMIKQGVDNRAIFTIFDLLLTHNEWQTAETLLKEVEDVGDKSLSANVYFNYAKYYMSRGEWKKALNNLRGIKDDLQTEDANYALLLQGISLQRLKDHRGSLKFYNAIPATSKYHPHATLNIAVAYIRQGWWTDAKIAIDKILDDHRIKITDEMTNRLYLVTGYSLLQQGYYRNSRQAFRNIDVDSHYANRALLGIALTASNQEDYVGALNAINILRQKKTFDLSVDEANLLLPYTYEKLSQNLTASKGYSEALAFYQKRVGELTSLLVSSTSNAGNIKIVRNNSLEIGNNHIDYARYYPASFLQNHTELKALQPHVERYGSSNLKNRFNSLLAQHNATLIKIARNLVNIRIEHLNSYMSQSRFGLARLYDNSVATK
ncbi:MAG: tetratricopeptide repeat protein [Gammaproteobacteria bacterium]|nr:tetratricopeptide repeat protein [Gammaproteobacteria bacterium]